MPKDDTSQSIVNSQPSTVVPPPPTVPVEDMDTPPMVPPTDASSVAPANDVVMPQTTPMATTPIASTPRKKFAGGRVIATILGLFLLVGGIGAGVLLVGQNQNPSERAAVDDCNSQDFRSCGSTCSPNGLECKWLSASSTCVESTRECGGGGGGGGICNPSTCSQCTVNGQPYPESCSSLNAKECQKDGSGSNTGYECTCTDITSSAGSCWLYVWRCTTLNPSVCGGGSDPAPGSYCSGTTCAVPNYPTCWVNHYRSNDNDDPTVNDISIGGPQASATLGATSCGAEQIDVNCNGGDLLGNGVIYPDCIPHPDGGGCSVSIRYENDCGTNPPPEPTPSAPPITAQCQNVKAYSETWTLLTDAQLAALRPTNKVNFCVTGVATGGSFDRARFTINGVLQPETTTVRPSSTDFCQLYTIPAGTTTFDVTAEIHHVTLGWK